MTMTRFRIFSDLHLEFSDWTPPPAAAADVIILAGDIAVGAHGIGWARQKFVETPVIYVPGNHEFYGAELPEALDALRAEARRYDVHFLDGDVCVVSGTRFLGTTLWTDGDRFEPERVREMHLTRAQWLAERLTEPFVGPTVVVTHHLPHEPNPAFDPSGVIELQQT
jgi:3',5'-cyclic AMP phosphodiesterase CpdA